MDDEHNQKSEAMMDVGEDSGIASNDSDSRRDSVSSMASMSSTATSRNDSAIGSMSDPRSSTSPNVSSTSGMSDISRSSRTSGHSSHGAGYSNSVSSSRRSSVSSVQSDDSTTTLRSDVTATSMKSERPQTSGLIEVQVKDHNNKTHIVRVRPTDKVKDLKSKVQEKLKIAPSQQRLQFQGKNLDDQSTSSLKCLGLHDSCTVRSHMRTLGGALFSTT